MKLIDYIPHSKIFNIRIARNRKLKEANNRIIVCTNEGDFYTKMPIRTNANGVLGEFYKIE